MASTGGSLEDFRERAEQAEQQIEILKERLNTLEAQLTDAEAKSNLKLGAPSSMGDDFQLNLRFLCERGVKIQPDAEIVTRIADGKYHRMTYLQAQKTATQLASALSKLGINIGDRVGTFMWNNARHMCLYYAVPSMGAVLHTLKLFIFVLILFLCISKSNESKIYLVFVYPKKN